MVGDIFPPDPPMFFSYFVWQASKIQTPIPEKLLCGQDAVNDPLIPAKLQFFSYVAGIVEPFLRLYQTDNPYDSLRILKSPVKQLIETTVEHRSIEECKTRKQLKELDLSDKKIFLPLNKRSIGFAADRIIKNLKRSDIVGNSQIKEFFHGAKHFIIKAV